jgi:AraC family L-rhamnose operon transcriptional activator RhaR
MNWVDRLNTGARRVSLGESVAEVVHWAYADHLVDNVPHRHTYFEICLVGRYGSGIFTTESTPHVIESGDIFFARPGVVHQIQNTGPELMELFWVSFVFTPQATEKADSWARAFAHSPLLVARDDGTLAHLWQALRSAASAQAGAKVLLAQLQMALLTAILNAGTPRAATAGASMEISDHAQWNPAQLAIRYIHDNLDRRLPVEEVAAHLHVSSRHLARLFQESVGTSPATYIETARLDRACALLRDAELPIKSIAQQVGYPDVQHFTRAFARRIGTSPGRFRQAPHLLQLLPKPADFM